MSDKDRPGGMLEISPALERDMDKAAAGKIPAPPIEAFMSDAALQDAQDATTAAAAPVHAENLRPISGAEAARRSTFDGTTLPGHGRQRRVIPAPFRRDRAVGAVHHGKEWVTVRAWQLEAGDIVPGTGLVTSVGTRNRYKTRGEVMGREELSFASRSDDPIAVGVDVILRGAGGVETILDSSSEVRAFRPPDPGS
jgi:hypothetical protein